MITNVSPAPFSIGQGPFVDTTNVTADLGTDPAVENAEGDHELRFMHLCFLIPSFPAARIAACASGTGLGCGGWVPQLVQLPALDAGCKENDSEVKEDTDGEGEHGWESDPDEDSPD